MNDLYEKELERIEKLLREKGIEIKEYECDITGEVYRYALVDFSTMQRLKKMEKDFKQKLQKELEGEIKRPYYHIAKLICADAPIDYFHIAMQKKYIYVKDKEKILKDLDKLFEIWKNTKIKHAKAWIKKYNVDETEAKKFLDSVMQKIGEAYVELSNIKKNPDKYEMIRTNYHYAKYYPEIIYRVQGEDRYRTTLLRKSVINILCYESKKREKKRRRDMEIEAFLKDAYNPFEYIYVKKRK